MFPLLRRIFGLHLKDFGANFQCRQTVGNPSRCRSDAHNFVNDPQLVDADIVGIVQVVERRRDIGLGYVFPIGSDPRDLLDAGLFDEQRHPSARIFGCRKQ